MKNVMLDLETFGNKSNSVIAAIAAVEFDLETGQTGKEFYKVVDIQSCLDYRLKVDGSTIKWWLEQSHAARMELVGESTRLDTALNALATGAGFDWKNACVWGNGSSFDLGILADAYHACKLDTPWKHYNERDVRTLVSFAPEIKHSFPKPRTAHHALQDCHYQIGYCSAIYQSLKQVPV